jgi:hypothetical protein
MSVVSRSIMVLGLVFAMPLCIIDLTQTLMPSRPSMAMQALPVKG